VGERAERFAHRRHRAVRAARRRAVRLVAAAVLVAVAPGVAARFTADRRLSVGWSLLAGLVVIGLLSLLWPRVRAVRADKEVPALLSGASRSGERLVDLRRLVAVSAFGLPSKAGPDRPALILRDDCGLWFTLTERADFARVATAVERQRRKAEFPPPRVSRQARQLLERGSLRWYTDLGNSVLAMLAWTCCVFGVVVLDLVIAQPVQP
jgi:hypothetical protein